MNIHYGTFQALKNVSLTVGSGEHVVSCGPPGSPISAQELTFKTLEVVTTTRAFFEAWITTAAFCFVKCFGLSMLFGRFDPNGE